MKTLQELADDLAQEPRAAKPPVDAVWSNGLRRRRRRSTIIAGLVGAALLVAAAGVITLDRDDQSLPVASDGGETTTVVPTSTEPSSTLTTSSTSTAVAPTTTVAPVTTTTVAPTTTTAVPADPDEAAARAFIDAWRTGDAEAMRRVGTAEAVDIALSMGHAEGPTDCRSISDGQYQCVVNVTDIVGPPQAYLLVGEPGSTPGLVWWVAQYHPDT